jgi:hypothetical protein
MLPLILRKYCERLEMWTVDHVDMMQRNCDFKMRQKFSSVKNLQISRLVNTTEGEWELIQGKENYPIFIRLFTIQDMRLPT